MFHRAYAAAVTYLHDSVLPVLDEALGRERLRQIVIPEIVGAWLVAKASIGRSGFPP